MKLYLVRHGQTNNNSENRHQFPDTPLNQIGSKQAEVLAARFKTVPVDIIISSSYLRALQTAQAIQKVTHKELLTSDFFIERKNPTLFNGKLRDDPEILPIKKIINENETDLSWHYSDEENFADLLLRVKRALSYILSTEKEHVVIITHGYVLSFTVCYMLLGEKITPQLFREFRHSTHYSNTGLTMCEYTDEKWKILTWNDYAHLGE